MTEKKIIVAIVAVVAAVVGILWWQTSTRMTPESPIVTGQPVVTPPPPTPPKVEATAVNLKNDPQLGAYLGDNTGRALYIFAKDANGQSACDATCSQTWPAFNLKTIAIGPGLDMVDFATSTRADGTAQMTYYGLPLYYYAPDVAGDGVKGEGVDRLWYVATADYTVLFANKDGHDYLINAEDGHTLYQYSKDAADVSSCTGTCLKNWPVFNVDKVVVPSFIDMTRFGGIVRKDKAHQTAFDRHPLYEFVQDKARGDMKGEGFNGVWSTVDPFAAAPPAPVSASIDVSEKDKGTTVRAKQGDTVNVVLNSTYWTLQDPDAKILKPLMTEPKVTPDFKGVPGSGSGTVEMQYQVVGTGTAKIGATRDSCGEAMRCTGENGKFQVTLVATAS